MEVRVFMFQYNQSYVQELEHLILDKLLPVYANYQVRQGASDRYEGINPKLIELIKQKKQVPALLKAKEIST